MSTSPPKNDPAAVVRAYFEATDSLDPQAVGRLYARHAEIVVDGTTTARGIDAVIENYARWMRAMEPGAIQTRLGPLIACGPHVAVEIEIVAGGRKCSMSDFFTIADGKIERLAAYVDPATLPPAMLPPRS